MGDLEDFKSNGFKMFLETSGIAKVQFMEENQEMPYKAKCFINGANTIGYAEVDIQDRHEVIFISKTSQGEVITMTGEPEGPLPIKAPGIMGVFAVKVGAPIEAIFAAHQKAFGTEKPLVEPDWIKEQAPKLPQKALDIAMVAMNEILSSFGGMDGLVEAMGNMMSGAMDGLGKGLQEAFSGLGGADGQEPPMIIEEPPIEEHPDVDELPDHPIVAKPTGPKKTTKAKPKAAKAPAKKPKAAPKPKPKAKAKPVKKKGAPRAKPKARPKKKR